MPQLDPGPFPGDVPVWPAPFTEPQRPRCSDGPRQLIGLATVTYLFDGRIRHRDSLGTEMVIAPGDVNLMTAGRGIVHSERTPEELRGAPMSMSGLQT